MNTNANLPNLFAVRGKVYKHIRKLEEDQEEVDADSSEWKVIEQKIIDKRKQLFKIEFMIYSGESYG